MTPAQMRMARAALNIGVKTLAHDTGVSRGALSRFESSQRTRLNSAEKVEQYFASRGIYFGPKDAVAVGVDIFASDRWLAGAMVDLLQQSKMEK